MVYYLIIFTCTLHTLCTNCYDDDDGNNNSKFINYGLSFEMGRQIYSQSGDVRESSYLFKRISVAVQRFNSVLLHDTLTVTYRTYTIQHSCFYLLF